MTRHIRLADARPFRRCLIPFLLRGAHRTRTLYYRYIAPNSCVVVVVAVLALVVLAVGPFPSDSVPSLSLAPSFFFSGIVVLVVVFCGASKKHPGSGIRFENEQ